MRRVAQPRKVTHGTPTTPTRSGAPAAARPAVVLALTPSHALVMPQLRCCSRESKGLQKSRHDTRLSIGRLIAYNLSRSALGSVRVCVWSLDRPMSSGMSQRTSKVYHQYIGTYCNCVCTIPSYLYQSTVPDSRDLLCYIVYTLAVSSTRGRGDEDEQTTERAPHTTVSRSTHTRTLATSHLQIFSLYIHAVTTAAWKRWVMCGR